LQPCFRTDDNERGTFEELYKRVSAMTGEDPQSQLSTGNFLLRAKVH